MLDTPLLFPNKSVFTCSLASGSNGNCYYVGNEDHGILIDVGISCRELERRMQRNGLHLSKIKAIFISHEHSDHIKGLTVVANKYQIPIYITDKTFNALRLAIPSRLINFFVPDQPITLGAFEVKPFSKYHDAAEPQSFLVEAGGKSIGIFTDLGRVCDQLIKHFQACDVAFLETNYEEELLDQGKYPYYLKRRIKSGFGHLSNAQALELFMQHRTPKLQLLYLCHLSRDNNHPDLVLDLFRSKAEWTEIVLASRECETAVHQFYLEEREAVG